ncbi:uncharacterized protein LOC132628468 [Lycium barbarum]|uniref:uncharacterized protein LOC132628468 n=1 Tax=Lycium barbarum TaxID=112863 RepID=UPI00293ECD32|nr:uncharacterized protein LOC132628468 [Lycium barbarum]
MENFLHSKEFWSIIETGFSEPDRGVVMTEAQQKVLDEQRLKDLKAKNYLFQAIDRAILETIFQKDTSKQIWDSMKSKYAGTTKVKRQQLQDLRKEFEVLHMKEGESVDEYFTRTFTVVNKMRIYGGKLDDVNAIEKILRSMSSKFAYVVCSIEEEKDIDIMSIDELQSSLLIHEHRLVPPSTEEQALKVSTQFDSSNGNGFSREVEGVVET